MIFSSRLMGEDLFSLFHHQLFSTGIKYFNTEDIFSLTKLPVDKNFNDLSEIIFLIVTRNLSEVKSSEVSLTLTGGMDSRVLLAALLRAEVKPNCFTYGNPQSKDVLIAKGIANKLCLPFHNACKEEPTKDWYYKWIVETIRRDKGKSHLHRAHRTAAIADHSEQFHPRILFTGHMGGEGIRGLSYNNYFSSPFFEMVNERRIKIPVAASHILNDYFIKGGRVDYDDLTNKILKLTWMKNDRETNRFFFLFDLVAKIHHSQDIRIYQSYIDKVIPVYMQEDYLKTLFSSPYHLLTKKNSFFSRLRNPYIYCKIIELLYPKLLDFPFANGFSPRDYLKGYLYYIPVKLYRSHVKKLLYPPSFSYGKWYYDFVREHSLNIDAEIWEIYDKKKYFKALDENIHGTDEGYWHKFSNPIFIDLVRKYKNDEIEQ